MGLHKRIFIGIDCDENQLTMAFIGSTGLLSGLSHTYSPLLDEIPKFVELTDWMVRGLRGDENLRMKNFLGVGLGLPNDYLEKSGRDIEDQLTRNFKIPVYVQDRDLLRAAGELWLKDCSGMIDRQVDLQNNDLRGVYGAAKLVIDKMI